MDILFEIADRRDVYRIERIGIEAGGTVSIGRAYDNAIILQDIHVSPYHGQVSVDAEGQWWYDDLDSLNGSFDSKNQRVRQRTAMQSGDSLRLGNLQIRLLTPQHPVAPAVALDRWPFLQRLQQPLWLILLFGLGLAIFMLISWLELTEVRKASEWIKESIIFFVMACVWGGFWALIGKLICHQARFGQQLGIAILILITFMVTDPFYAVLNFNIGSTVLDKIDDAIMLIMILGTGLSISLEIATQSRKRSLKIWAYGGATLLTALTILLPLQKKMEFSPEPAYIGTIAPPVFMFRKGTSIDQFIGDSDGIFSRASVKK